MLQSWGMERLDTFATVDRWMRMMTEMTGGRDIDASHVFKTFDCAQYDGMIVLGSVPFASLCEHHLLPFTGKAWIGYLPNARTGRIVGLSKLARLVDIHARRFQVQERMTNSIAADIMKHLGAAGAGVRIKSVHSCMSCRGIKKEGVMSTQTLLGAFREAHVKLEFDQLCQ